MLTERARQLEEDGIVTIAVQAEEARPDALAAWLKDAGIPFPAGVIRQDILERRYEWSVRALPWLILTDAQHIVLAEGFAADELDQKL